MTMPVEEVYALKNTRRFFEQVDAMKKTEFSKKARWIREEAIHRLRHYPFDYAIDKCFRYNTRYRIAVHVAKDLLREIIAMNLTEIRNRQRRIRTMIATLVDSFPPDDAINFFWFQRINKKL